MPFIRLSDDYNDHPKFSALSDGAFRLWHQGMGFCRKYQTDGIIPTVSLRQLKAYGPKRMRELMTPWKDGENPLWHPVEGVGVSVHDYLQWNPSKDEENERRADSKERMRLSRERRTTRGVPPPLHVPLQRNAQQTSREVPGEGREGSGSELEKRKDARTIVADDLGERAGRLLARYVEWYEELRHGAKLRLLRNSLEFQDAIDLCAIWPDDRLEKLAKIVLTTDDGYISGTDRGFKIFSRKASWADERLAKWERQQATA